MTSAYILIAAILILGGLIAALGDRLGTKVGKARLRLFKLRPRQTAIFVTVMTGILIAASTLGILFGLSKSLRQGIFQLDDILRQRREAQNALRQTLEEKSEVEEDLLAIQEQQKTFNQRLQEINQDFQQAQAQLDKSAKEAKILEQEVKILRGERQKLDQQRQQLKGQINQLQSQISQQRMELNQRDEKIAQREGQIQTQEEIIAQREGQIQTQEKILAQQTQKLQRLEAEQNQLQQDIAQRDQSIKALDTEIALRDQELQAREATLDELTKQLEFLQREVAVLEQFYQNYQVLRQGNVALVKGQVLAFATVRVDQPENALQAIDQLLNQANIMAIQSTRAQGSASDTRVVQITKAQVRQILEQIKDGQEYVVRILSAGNFVQGEPIVIVLADVTLNKIIFENGESVATISLEKGIKREELRKRLDLLLAASEFRARRAGILGEVQVGDGNITRIINFFEQLNASLEPIEELKAIASLNTYTAGPLELRLVALRDGKIVFST